MDENVQVKDLQSLVDPLLHLCLEAGAVICAHYFAPEAADYESKHDDSPLTRADLASHAVLQAGLSALDADIPVLSEESTPAELTQRRLWRRYWLVDPLDGTREFLDRTGEFTVNIALIDEHRPILGILYLPLERVAYVGIPGALACRYRDCGEEKWAATALATRNLQAGKPLSVLSSHRQNGTRMQVCLAWLAQNWGPVSRTYSGSALKFCQLAEGQGDIYPRFSPCCEWDTAAGQAVLEAAGGCLLGLDGEPLRYNCGDSLYSPHFYAIANFGHPLWGRLLQDQPR
jgi:3'(2'), 5'-bisphosphate nucleotidase